MATRKKSKTMKLLDEISGGPLLFKEMLHGVRTMFEVTQVELAKRAGTTKAKICDYEKGRRTPTLAVAARLARELGYPESVFISTLIEEQLRDANIKLKFSFDAA